MKHLPHIAAKLFATPTVLTPQHHSFLCGRLESWLAGNTGGPSVRPVPKAHDDNPDLYDEEDAGTPDCRDNMGIKYRNNGTAAIIPVYGTLVAHPEDIAMSECGCSMEGLGMMIDRVESNARVEKTIYDFRTPGGAVTLIPETGRKILNSRKETIAFTDSDCCSGGLWLASQCQKFYATGSSNVGSCGVYTMCLDMSKALEKDGIQINAIHAGKFKLLGAYWKPLTAEERDILQVGVDKIWMQFKDAIQVYRVIDDEDCGNGLVFDGETAVEKGFVDGLVEGIEDILDDMVE